jgi:transcription initiation factor IIF auxiliary subunit
MQHIRYPQATSSHTGWAMQKSEWFGCSGELSKGITASNYHSFSKRNKTDLEKQTEAFKRIEKAHQSAHCKVESNKALTQTIEMHKREIVYLTTEIERVSKIQDKINRSARMIQKIARGYLVRKNLEFVSFT